MFALLPSQPIFVTAFFTLLVTAGGTAVVAQVGREQGRKKQPSLWKSWGGPPTTRLLRHHHPADDLAMPSGLRQKVEEWAGYPLPDHQDEETCSAWADTKYEEVVRSLLEATRDTSRFPLVFAENVNYGYRRNLWGLRPFGTPIAVILTLCSWTLLALTIWGRPWPEPWWDIFPNPDSVAVIRLAVAVANTSIAAFWLFWVKPSWVKVVADAFAIKLFESVETLGNK